VASDPAAFNNIRVVLCAPSHPGNIGAAARAMKTMGLSQLWLVNPARFPDPEANWRASRATDVLEHAHVCTDLAEALRGTVLAVACSARDREVAVPAVSARVAAGRLAATAHAGEVALVFGNETYGLTTAEVNLCALRATIPADAEYSSLNLGAAVQVFAYELRLAVLGDAAPPPQPERARHEDVEGFYTHLETTMAEIGFLDPEHPKKLMPRVRRLFARAGLEPEEVNILRGILKALRHPKKRG